MAKIDEQKRKDLLARYGKSVELVIKLIEDDSSGDGTDGGTQVKILHLVNKVSATGSNPTPDGGPMNAADFKVYVAAEDIDTCLADCEEKDGLLIYKGPMHLDVSKPTGRNVNGQFTVTKPAKIWLTSTKFSRRGNQLRQTQQGSAATMVNKFFAGGKVFDLDVAPVVGEAAGEAKSEDKKPEVVPNKAAVAAGK